VTWLTPAGDEVTPAHWQNPPARALGILLDGRAQPTGIRKRGTEVTLLLALNAYYDSVTFTLPQVVGGTWWRCLLDTNHVDDLSAEHWPAGAVFEASGRSLHLFDLTLEALPAAKD
jgi:glycogen operon protein